MIEGIIPGMQGPKSHLIILMPVLNDLVRLTHSNKFIQYALSDIYAEIYLTFNIS